MVVMAWFKSGEEVCIRKSRRGEVLAVAHVLEHTDDADTQIANVEQWLTVQVSYSWSDKYQQNSVRKFRRHSDYEPWTPCAKKQRGTVYVERRDGGSA